MFYESIELKSNISAAFMTPCLFNPSRVAFLPLFSKNMSMHDPSTKDNSKLSSYVSVEKNKYIRKLLQLICMKNKLIKRIWLIILASVLIYLFISSDLYSVHFIRNSPFFFLKMNIETVLTIPISVRTKIMPRN